MDLERVQKAAVKVIMGNDYVDYTTSLKELYITNLVQRREKLIKNMATKITNNEKVKNMFPLRTELRSMKRRHTEKYESIKENTDRLQTLAVPYMQDIMNQHYKEIRNGCKTELMIKKTFFHSLTLYQVPANFTLCGTVASQLHYTGAHHCVE